MKRIALVAIAALVLAGFGATTALSESSSSTTKSTPQRNPVPAHCTIGPFRAFSRSVWAFEHWQRGELPPKVSAALRRRLSCAPPGHRKAMARTWERDKAAFAAHRKAMLWREKFKPFVYPDGSRWAAPYPVAWCESGGNYYVGPSGAYGEIPPLPQNQPPKVQDEIAYHLLHTAGEYQAWARWETGCAYR